VKKQTIFVDAIGNPLPSEEQERLWQAQIESDAARDASQIEKRNRELAIERFRRQQAIEHDWISLDDVVDWRSRDRVTGVAREDYRLGALKDIDLAIRTGRYFFVDSQSRILLTFPFVDVPQGLYEDPLTLPQQYWLYQNEWLAGPELYSLRPGETEADHLQMLFLTSYLKWAWIPRDLCLLWSKNVPFEPRPEWLENYHPERPPISREEAGQRAKILPRGVPEWEPLNKAMLRLVGNGISEDDAKATLSSLIADRRIEMRAVMAADELFGAVFYAINPPDRLLPDDFDWEGSRPVEPWHCGGGLDSGTHSIAMLELSTRDLIALLPRSRRDVVEPAPPEVQPVRRIAERLIEPEFKKWREQRPDNIPTEAEDIQHMKQFGVGRDRVRDLRKNFPRRKRGEKR
jgi:hypothetical protein